VDLRSDILGKPGRPTVVTIAAALLLGSAVLLAANWIVRPASVISNGGQVFFIMLWLLMAHAAFRGLSWVRLAIFAIFAASAWGLMNEGSISVALTDTTFTDVTVSIFQITALLLLSVPTANKWFSSISELRKSD
jgi:hypothetical protein